MELPVRRRRWFGVCLGRDKVMHGAHDFGAIGVVDAIVHFLAAFFAHQQFRVAQDFQVMRYRRAADLEKTRDVVDANFFTGFEHQENLLTGGIAEREEKTGEPFPAVGQVLSELGIHETPRSWDIQKNRIG